MNNSNIFLNTLSNFTHDVAGGDAIRHLTDLGYTAYEIRDRLDYPIPLEKIGETMWKHLVNSGVILLEEQETANRERASYVKDTDSFGRISFRRVTTSIDNSDKQYVECDFGRRIYQDKVAFEKSLEILQPRDRDYIRGLKWPLSTVYHVLDDRMSRLIQCGIVENGKRI